MARHRRTQTKALHGVRSTPKHAFRTARNAGMKVSLAAPTIKFGPAGKRVNPQAY